MSTNRKTRSSSAQPASSRRSKERRPFAHMVNYRVNGEEYGNLGADISEDGLFIRTFVPPAVGTNLEITVRLPRDWGGLPITLQGQVVRVVEGNDPRQRGMGVSFSGLHTFDVETIRQLVTRIFGLDRLSKLGD